VRATLNLRRTVAIEFGTCRSGRKAEPPGRYVSGIVISLKSLAEPVSEGGNRLPLGETSVRYDRPEWPMFAGFTDKGLRPLGYTLGYFGRGSIPSRPGGLSRGPWCWRPGGPDALVGLPGGPWRPRPATCPALPAQLFGCTHLSERLSLTRGSERLPTSGRLGDITGIPCARHRSGRLFVDRAGEVRGAETAHQPCKQSAVRIRSPPLANSNRPS
jgi:hypothetical protein